MLILLLEDELMLQGAISEYLTDLGYKVDVFENADEVYEHVMHKKYDLFIFDINTPGITGLELLTRLQSKKIYIPTIFISAITEIEQISQAYALGCYDYLKKPFHLQELSLKIERIKANKETPSTHIRLSKNYSYDQEHSALLFEDTPQTLTKKQSQIIELLAKNRNMVVDFEQFRIYVWDEHIIDNATIRAEINRLKKVLKEDILINVRGMGYMIEKPS